jgi:hypothetical protein
MKITIALAIIILSSSCCIYRDIQESIGTSYDEIPGGYTVKIQDVYKPSDRVRNGDVYKTE